MVRQQEPQAVLALRQLQFGLGLALAKGEAMEQVVTGESSAADAIAALETGE